MYVTIYADTLESVDDSQSHQLLITFRPTQPNCTRITASPHNMISIESYNHRTKGETTRKLISNLALGRPHGWCDRTAHHTTLLCHLLYISHNLSKRPRRRNFHIIGQSIAPRLAMQNARNWLIVWVICAVSINEARRLRDSQRGTEYPGFAEHSRVGCARSPIHRFGKSISRGWNQELCRCPRWMLDEVEAEIDIDTYTIYIYIYKLNAHQILEAKTESALMCVWCGVADSLCVFVIVAYFVLVCCFWAYMDAR